METEKGDWGFKALKQAIKTELKLGLFEKVIEHYTELLTYVKSAVTRNYSEKSINSMLDYVEKGGIHSKAVKCMERVYSLTLDCLQSTNNERLWLKTSIKLAKLLLVRKNYFALTKKLRELHKSCQRPDGTDDPSKGTYSLEIYALEIQMHAETKNKQLKRLYQRALQVRSAVPHPKIMGIIRECGGKMHMSEEKWKEAQSDFFESFRNYDEAGSLQRIRVLKYLLLTTMLAKSEINPFDSQETKPYKNDSRITAMTELVEAYQRDDVHGYEKVLRNNKDLLADSFIAENIDEVTRNMRIKGMQKLIAPYTRMRISWIANQLDVTIPEVMDILGYLIVAGTVNGLMDEHAGTLIINSNEDAQRTQAMTDLALATEKMATNTLTYTEGFRNSDFSNAAAPDLDLNETGGDSHGGTSHRSHSNALHGKGKRKVGGGFWTNLLS